MEEQRLIYPWSSVVLDTMARDGDEMYAFVCPECTESLEVDRGMKDALVQHGCIICDASLTADAFTRIEPPDSA